MQIRDEELDKELLAAFHRSGLSHQKVIDLMTKVLRQEDVEDGES